MPRPNFFASRTAAGTAFFLLALLPGISSGTEPAKAKTPNPLTMYFDDSQMVEVATRALKPMSQVAENVSVITVEEIEAMHARTLGEILDSEAGFLIAFFGRDFLGDEAIKIAGGNRQHTLLLMDGIRLNLNSNGYAIANFIPTGIIKRIEIIKGPASSAWGSAQGGVINVITKDTGRSSLPQARVQLSYGEAASREANADLVGGFGQLGYYLYAGSMHSDGIILDRRGQRDSLFGKLKLELPGDSSLTFIGGKSDPSYRVLNWNGAWGIDGLDLYEEAGHENFWGAIQLDSKLSSRLSLHLSGQRYDNDFTREFRSLRGASGPNGDFIYGERWDDRADSFVSRLSWTDENLAANLGFETSRSKMVAGRSLGVMFGGPDSTSDEPLYEERRGLYTNLTWTHDRMSITPGVRHDFNANSGDIVSPSLGITYQLCDDTTLRASVARGFSAPFLAAVSSNPDLKPEKILSGQAGIETHAFSFARFKATIFHADITDAWDDGGNPTANNNSLRLRGLELDARSKEFHGLSLQANCTTILTDTTLADGSDIDAELSQTVNLIFHYRGGDGIRARLAGHYFWMDRLTLNEQPENGGIIWDLVLAKHFLLGNTAKTEAYLKAHNLFNGSQYWDFEYPNPGRWFEAGLLFRF